MGPQRRVATLIGPSKARVPETTFEDPERRSTQNNCLPSLHPYPEMQKPPCIQAFAVPEPTASGIEAHDRLPTRRESPYGSGLSGTESDRRV